MVRRRWQAALGLVLVMAACRQIVGIEEREAGDPPPPGPSCEIETQSESCTDCMESRCCQEIADCADDAICQDRFACLAGCKDPKDEICRAACSVSGIGSADDNALTGCQARECAVECGLRCGGVLGSHFPTYVEPGGCVDCLEEKGCDQAIACAQIPACMAALGCGARCPLYSYDCRAHCYTGLDPAVSDAYLDVRVGGIDGCRAKCGAGESWDCSAPWPTNTEAVTVPITVEVNQIGSANVPIDGVQVKACNAFDVDCDFPLVDAVQTDVDGRADLILPAGGFQGFFALDRLDYTGHAIVVQSNIVYPFHEAPLELDFLSDQLVSDLVDSLDPEGNDPLDADLGLLAIEIHDCHNTPGAGIHYEFDGMETVVGGFFTTQALLQPNLTETNTDTATYGAYNVPPGTGTLHVEAYRGFDEQKELVAFGDVPMSAGRIGWIRLVPRK